ncbi:TonB-dependent receptor [Pseudoduganella plicata]|uniref:TonB-dependent receptor n=1 Tax=Pseudoduganella plicata TaxID=321984 RepID=A0A4P7BD26_9BURK|nr:TonB-dependent receptor [Pseudoduganella plicata]QBQ35817.1 TonB-dependent receptor [Pseudoduganella plicata]GGY94827.1 TonB-dependent receptor [Pseudoduganella plicata]
MIDHRVRPHRHLLAACISSAVATLCSGSAHAQSEAQASSEIPEVVVTAQRTSTLESKTPVAMSVLGGDRLAAAGFDNPAQLGARLPNVRLDSSYDGMRITIRGVTSADTTDKGDPSAAFMMDGIYIARPQNQGLSFFDVDRVEVLRGPQGTLYGRNTTAGAINVITNAPTQQLEAVVAAEAGNYNSRKGSAMLNVPISPALAIRAAVAFNRHDSYLTNAQGTPHTLGQDRDDVSARISARLAFSNTASLLLRFDHSIVRDNLDGFVPDTNFYRGIETGRPVWYGADAGARLTNRFVPPNTVPEQGGSRKTTSGVGADFSWQLGPVTLQYLGSHRQFAHDFLVNYYYRVAPTFALGVHQNFAGDYRQDSHELRVATNGTGPLAAQAGVYWFRERSDTLYTFRDLEPLGLPPYYVFPTGPTEARSRAVFGQATYALLPRLRATLGARWTEDDKTRVGSTDFQQGPVFNPASDYRLLNAAALTTHKTTWRAGLDFDVAPGTMAYAAVSTGYKAGGFNDGCLAGSRQLGIDCPAAVAVPASTLFYQPETLTSVEAGIKSRFWDKRASINLAVFDYDYKNLQLSGVAMVMGAPRYVTRNAGKASVRGLEADGAVNVIPGGRVTYAFTLLDAHYDSYMPDGVTSWAGRKLDRAPSHTVTLGYEQRFRVGQSQLTAGATVRRSGSYVIGVPTQGLEYNVPAHNSSDARIAWQPDGAAWNVLARVRNIENKVQPLSIDSFGMTVPGEPRTFEARVEYRF